MSQFVLGFIGAGQMATALAAGFVRAGLVDSSGLRATDVSLAAREAFVERFDGAQSLPHAPGVLAASDIVFLSVKPQHAPSVFAELAGAAAGADKLIVSVVAGLTLSQLAEGLQTERLVRVMPNTPCLIGKGAAGLARGRLATDDDVRQVQSLLASVGLAVEVGEPHLDVITALSGSGPAYVYLMIEALSDGAVRMGLPRAVATQFAAQTLAGAAEMVLQTGEHPAVLKDQVASPGGTTLAGYAALEQAGVRAALIAAVEAATRRAIELGGQ